MSFAGPLLSVIIPVFNGEKYLAETLQSVAAQNYNALDIVVVDDGSSDRSAEVAQATGMDLRLIHRAHHGLAATRNAGILAARGAFLLHLDSDDLLPPNSILLRMQILNDNPGLDMVIGKVINFMSPDIPESDRGRYVIPDPQHGHLPGAAIIRTSVFERIGLLDESFVVNADLDWSVRAQDLGATVRLIDDGVVLRRIHGKNQTITHKAQMAPSQLRILRASLERRRGQANAGAAP